MINNDFYSYTLTLMNLHINVHIHVVLKIPDKQAEQYFAEL